jgi:hypothetical protein
MLGAFVVIGLAAASTPTHRSFAYVVDLDDNAVSGDALDGTNALLPLSPASTGVGAARGGSRSLRTDGAPVVRNPSPSA